MLPKRFPDREEIATVRTEAAELEPGAEGEQGHRLAGRVLARRDLGKLMFQWMYWHLLLPGHDIPAISSQMRMTGKKPLVEAGAGKKPLVETRA